MQYPHVQGKLLENFQVAGLCYYQYVDRFIYTLIVLHNDLNQSNQYVQT
jgi:hypothetical protein